MAGFREEFLDQFETGAEALENAGYDIIRYGGEITSEPAPIRGEGETPEDALDNTLSELESHRDLFFHLANDEFYDAIQGEQNPEQLIYRNLRGIIEPDEPLVETGWSEEQGSTSGALVRYIPGDVDHWEITIVDTLQPYTVEDAQERAEGLVNALEEYGLEAELGDIN